MCSTCQIYDYVCGTRLNPILEHYCLMINKRIKDRVRWIKQTLPSAIKNTPNKLMVFRAILLVVLTMFSGWCSYNEVERVLETQIEDIEAREESRKNDAEKNAVNTILKQSEQFQSWSVLILTGIVALLITTTVHRTPGASWAYIVLGPAAIFLIISLNAGWTLTKRYTFLTAMNNFDDFASLANLLLIQSNLFLYSILSVSLFASWFLTLIVLGKIEPFEVKKD